MLFSRRISLGGLIQLCRTLRHHLSAGLTLREVFRQQSERGPREVRPAAARIHAGLDRGDSLAKVLEKEKNVFPPLFLALTQVGEETGHLPEIFKELEDFFSLQLKNRRQLLSQMLLPVIQFVLALCVIAILIAALGMIAATRGGDPPKVLGHSGLRGGVNFLILCFAAIVLLWLAYKALVHVGSQKAAMDGFLLRIPGLGPCLEALAMSRFTLALSLTLDTAMNLTKAVRLGLTATGNAYFQAATDRAVQVLKKGDTLAEALTAPRIFREDFLNMVASAEVAGMVPEMLRQQAAYYQEEVSRKIATLTKLAGFGIWLIYAAFMIIVIFRIANMYLGALEGK